MKKFCREYLVALQNTPKKYLICAKKLSLNEGNYAFKIDGGRQNDRQTDKVSYRGASLLKILLPHDHEIRTSHKHII